MRVLGFFLLGLLPVSSFAAPSTVTHCRPLKVIQDELELCDDNEKFSRAAEACASTFKAKVLAEQAVLQKQLNNGVAEAARGGMQQAGAQGVTVASYRAMDQKLGALLVEGEGLRAEVGLYIKSLVWPFRWSAEMGPRPSDDDPDLQKLFDQDFCYGEHKEIMEHALGDFDKMLSDLRNARANAQKLAGNSRESQTQMQGAGPTGPTQSQAKQQGTPTPVAPKENSQTSSDITGVQEDAQKSAQPPGQKRK